MLKSGTRPLARSCCFGSLKRCRSSPMTLPPLRRMGACLRMFTGAEHSGGAHDLIIAATAVVTRRTILTTDRGAHYADLPGVDCLIAGLTPSAGLSAEKSRRA